MGNLTNSRGRDECIDAFRGLALIVMTLNHLPPNPVQRFAYGPVGFFTAAFVFVFLSGYVGMWRVAALAQKTSRGVARKAVFKRVLVLMGAHHVVATAIALAFIVLPGASGALSGVLTAYHGSPLRAWAFEMCFVNQTVFLDILSLYVLLLPLLPLCLRFFDLGKGLWVLALSAALWFAVQVELIAPVANRFNRFTVLHPLAWQLLFVSGAWLGYRRQCGKRIEWLSRPAVRWSLAGVVACGFVLRQAGIIPFGSPTSPSPVPGFDTSDLGWWGLLNFGCAVAFIASIPAVWREKALRLVPTLSLLGRHSLGVFLCHFFVVYWVWFACSGVPAADVTDLNRFGIPLFAVAVLVMFGFAADQRHRSSGNRVSQALPALTPAKSVS